MLTDPSFEPELLQNCHRRVQRGTLREEDHKPTTWGTSGQDDAFEEREDGGVMSTEEGTDSRDEQSRGTRRGPRPRKAPYRSFEVEGEKTTRSGKVDTTFGEDASRGEGERG